MPTSSHNHAYIKPQPYLYSHPQPIWNDFKLRIFRVLSGLLLLMTFPVIAEIVTDGSLGAQVELPGKHFQITPELGQQLGGNLFHSFQTFNLNSDEAATFSGATSVQNVIARVTGGSPSQINGLIRSTIPNADLYLINPYGVMFGESAKLDLQGGFHVSTADYLKLQEGGRFDARNLNNSLLSVAPVAAFGFLTDSPAAISTQNSRLTVPKAKTLSLIGGAITLTGSEPPIYDETSNVLRLESHSWLLAESGVLRLASLAAAGEITHENISLSAPGGNISIHNTALNTYYTDSSGDIVLHGGVINMDSSTLNAVTVDRQGGDISVVADALHLQNTWFDNSSEGRGNSGNIYLKTVQLTLDSTSEISTDARGKGEDAGNAGAIGIESADLRSLGKITSETNGRGRAGNIDLNISNTLSVRGQGTEEQFAVISSSTMNDVLEKAGDAGTVTIWAGQVNLEDASISSGTRGSGHSGNISITAQQLKLTEGAQMGSGTFSSGQSGNIRLLIADTLTVAGYNSIGTVSGIFANSENETLAQAGNAGNIYIEAGQVQLLDGGNINSATYGSGQGGVVELAVADKLLLRGHAPQGTPSIIAASTTSLRPEIVAGNAGSVVVRAGAVSLEDTATISSDTHGAGQAGNIAIAAQHLKLTEGSRIGSMTLGSGQSGNIELIIADTLTVSGHRDHNGEKLNGIFASSENTTLDTAGNAGNIYIEAGEVRLFNGGRIDTATLGSGQGGNIELHAHSLHTSGLSSGIYTNSYSDQAHAGNAGTLAIQADHITLSDHSGISTQALHAGGGNIYIATSHRLHLDQGFVTTSVSGGVGNGGNITVDYPQFIVLNQGDIRAQADEGHGGNIYLAAQQFVYSIESVINASSNKGLDGEIWIDSPENSLGNDLSALPSAIPLEIGLKTPCSALNNENISSFAVVTRAGIPNLPDDLQSSYALESPQNFTQPRSAVHIVPKITTSMLKISCR